MAVISWVKDKVSILGYLVGSNVIRRILQWGRRRKKSLSESDAMWDSTSHRWLWRWTGTRSQGTHITSRTWKRRENRFSLRTSRRDIGIQPCQHLGFSHWNPFWTSDLPSCKIIHFFQAKKKDNRDGQWVDGFTLEILNREISDPLVYTGYPFVLRQEVNIF